MPYSWCTNETVSSKASGDRDLVTHVPGVEAESGGGGGVGMLAEEEEQRDEGHPHEIVVTMRLEHIFNRRRGRE